MGVLVGTSGWQYDDWAESFYPKGLPKSRWLEFYGSRFATVESNSAFYKLPERDLFESWAAKTPSYFVMSVKMSRYLTHIRRLRDPREPVRRLLERLEGLGSKRGPVLLQLPSNLKLPPELLSATLSEFPTEVRVAVEVRHEASLNNDLFAVLEKHGAAFCLTDRRNRRSPLLRTTSWGYVRFHEGTASPRTSYGLSALDSWAARIASLWSPSEDVYCYFNNDTGGCAPKNAHQFASVARRHGLIPAPTA